MRLGNALIICSKVKKLFLAFCPIFNGLYLSTISFLANGLIRETTSTSGSKRNAVFSTIDNPLAINTKKKQISILKVLKPFPLLEQMEQLYTIIQQLNQMQPSKKAHYYSLIVVLNILMAQLM